MKKLFALFVAVVYLSSTVGATVHLHYCMDELVNVSLSDSGDNKCTNCGMEKDGNCCSDENRLLKNDIDQGATGTIQFIHSPMTVAATALPDVTGDHTLAFLKEYLNSLAFPAYGGIDIHVRNCTFRI